MNQNGKLPSAAPAARGRRTPAPRTVWLILAAIVALAVVVLRQDTVGSGDTAAFASPLAEAIQRQRDHPGAAARITLDRSTDVGSLLGMRLVNTEIVLTAGGSTATAEVFRMGGPGSDGALDTICFASTSTQEHSGNGPGDPHVAVAIEGARATFVLTPPSGGPADTLTMAADACPDTPADTAPNAPAAAQPGSTTQRLFTATCGEPSTTPGGARRRE